MNIQVADTSEQSSRTLLRSDRCDDAALDAVERHILPLRTTRGLLLSGLQFAYRTRVEVLGGRFAIATSQASSRQFAVGSNALVPEHVRFDVLLLPTVATGGDGRGRLVLERPQSGCRCYGDRRPLAHDAAQCVFAAPAEPWTLALLASQFALSPAELGSRLFVENAAARDIINAQRLMHALILLLTTDLPIERVAALSGWAKLTTFKRAFRTRFLSTVNQLERPRYTSRLMLRHGGQDVDTAASWAFARALGSGVDR
ncbi:transcriptional regulator, AraC family [Burkholderia sp. H160]|nr:transcriptional regulator, AraC family [Burkholderia sp. H160]